jgi:hypothetical protein
MYMGVAGACAEQAANAGGGVPAALSATVTDPNPVLINTAMSTTSNPGEITSTVTASGGTSPYTFTWKLREISDPDNIYTIASQGTITTQTYDTATITSSFVSGFPPPPPPASGVYQVECKVTDSATPAASVTVASNNFGVDSL